MQNLRNAKTLPDYTELTLEKRFILLARRSYKGKKLQSDVKLWPVVSPEFLNVIIWQIEQSHSLEVCLKEEVINNH